MRIVTWNMQHGVPNPIGSPDLARGLDPLAALGGDVVALQELDRRFKRSHRADQPRVIADHLGGELVRVPALRRGGGTYGNALVVRGEIVTSEVLALAGRGEPRAAGVAVVEVAGRRWSVAVTHLSLDDVTAQRQLLTIFDALARLPAPRVLVGDLNLTTARVLPFSTAEGYHLVTGPPTIDARATPDRRIDHVLLQGARAEEAGVQTMPLSDHLAVWADLV